MSVDTSLLDEIPAAKLVWYQMRHHIAEALPYTGGGATLDDVEDRLDRGHAQLFCGPNCALVAEIYEHPSGARAHIWLAGGDLDELLEVEQYVAEWAKSLGCQSMTISGRKGWERVLRDRYEVVGAQVLLKRDLTDE